jgi:uncharacterized protein (DUF2384 family)
MLAGFMADVFESKVGGISPQKLSRQLRMPVSGKGGLTALTKLHRNTLTRSPASAIVQRRLGEIAKILTFAADLAGDNARAVVWFRYQPLAGFDNKTAEDLVRAGHGEAVTRHLENLYHGVHG